MKRIKYEHTANLIDRPTINFMMGLPGSGKSSEAKKMIGKDTFRINKDDIREMMQNGNMIWSYSIEAVAVSGSRAIGSRALEQGFNVIIDDTGFNEYHKEFWLKLAKKMNYNMCTVFIDSPLETCKIRCDARGGPVTAEVVQKMYDKYKDVISQLRNETTD